MQDLIQLAVPAFIALMIVEAIAGAIMHREIYELKDAAASITMGLGNLAVDLLAKVLQFSVLTYLHRFAIFPIGYQWWAWMLLPSHHRVHHGSNPRYIDRNHGGTLIIWDKLFGTFEPENPADPVHFGLTKNIQTYNPVRIAFHEWVEMFRDAWSAPGWRNKLRYIFGNPGWHHAAQDESSSPTAF